MWYGSTSTSPRRTISRVNGSRSVHGTDPCPADATVEAVAAVAADAAGATAYVGARAARARTKPDKTFCTRPRRPIIRLCNTRIPRHLWSPSAFPSMLPDDADARASNRDEGRPTAVRWSKRSHGGLSDCGVADGRTDADLGQF